MQTTLDRPIGSSTAALADPGVVAELEKAAPDLLPSRRAVPAGDAGDLAPHGTTIVAATFAGIFAMHAAGSTASTGHTSTRSASGMPSRACLAPAPSRSGLSRCGPAALNAPAARLLHEWYCTRWYCLHPSTHHGQQK